MVVGIRCIISVLPLFFLVIFYNVHCLVNKEEEDKAVSTKKMGEEARMGR